MATEVVPVWEQMKKEIPLQVRARCRRAGKSYDEFRAELEAEMKKSLSDLLRKHRCTPLPTMLVPLAVQIPLFITLSYLIREAALTPQFAAELLPWSTWSFTGPSAAEQAQLDAFAQSASILRDRGMNEETLAQIMGPRGGGASGGGIGTTLAQKDTSMQGPIALGMITLLNAELNAYRSRRDRDQLKDDIPKQATSDDQSSPSNSQALPPRTVTRPTASIATRDYRPKAAQAQSSARSETPAPKPAGSEDKAAVSPAKSAAEERTSLRTAIFTNTLRVAAIAFIPIASQVPGGLLVYWLSSAMYTMVQNGILDWREAKLPLSRSK
ncbi:hypothetical protein OC845_004081 [Tilletia horrida]|nr:hypothetical protein OC845_004081 [Tilletia horrida]